MRQVILAFILILAYSMQEVHGANDVLLNYSIYDKDGNLAVEGIGNGCGTPEIQNPYTIHRDIIAGEPFTLLLRMSNTDTLSEDGLSMWYGQILSEGYRYIGYGTTQNGPLINFTRYSVANGNRPQILGGDNITMIEHVVTYPFFDELLTFEVWWTGANQGNRCKRLKVRLHSDEYYRMFYEPGPIYNGNQLFFDITNFNDPAFFDPVSGTWDLTYTGTIRNDGSFGAYANYNFQCWEHYSNGTAIRELQVNCNPVGDRAGRVFIAAGDTQDISCNLVGAINTAGMGTFNECGRGFFCSNYITNSSYNYNYRGNYEDSSGVYGYLGQTACPAPRVKWKTIFQQPQLSSLWAVPGIDFNLTTDIYNYEGKGNYTVQDNLNLTTKVFEENTYALLSERQKWVLPNGARLTFNATSPSIINFGPVNISSFVPPGRIPGDYLTYMYPSSTLVATALAKGWAENEDFLDCNSNAENKPFATNISFCIEPSIVKLIRLIALDNQVNRVVRFASVGEILTYNYSVNNPLESNTIYDLSTTKLKPNPILITFIPDSIIVPRALTATGPGNNNGTTYINVVPTTRIGVYEILFKAVAQGRPDIFDTLILELHVVSKDVEVVAINKTPDKFIYNPLEVPKVDLKVLVRNNYALDEIVTLNLTIVDGNGNRIVYEGCGGESFTLHGYETKTVDCPDAHATLTEDMLENIVVIADLGLLSGGDTVPKNNHKYEILTIISQTPPPVTIPDANIWVFLAMLCLALFAMNKQGMKKRWPK